tara:strand:- start:287 stop:616 length:330 start_codon:yes stop_codon:yes gene_type:complete
MSTKKIEVAVGTVGPFRAKVTPPEGFPAWADTTAKTIEFFTSTGVAVGGSLALTVVDANLGIFSFDIDATVTASAQVLDSKLTFTWAGPARVLTTAKDALRLDVQAVAA